MTDKQYLQGVDGHAGMHSEHGANRGEHTGRAVNPTIKVADLAWLEFDKPDLKRAETFARDFGFVVAARKPDALYLRVAARHPRHGDPQGRPLQVCRADLQGRRETGPAAAGSSHRHPGRAAGRGDRGQRCAADRPQRRQGRGGPHQRRVARACRAGTTRVQHRHDPGAGQRHSAAAARTGARAATRSPGVADTVVHLHVELVSGHLRDDRQRLPVRTGAARPRAGLCLHSVRRGSVPTDHHTLALLLGPVAGYAHSAYQVTDFDAVAAGGEYLLEKGYHRAWGIGRHTLGSQIFDYWADPDKIYVEHFTDGDLFDNTLEAGWEPLTASSLAQWGPRVPQEFMGAKPSLELVRNVVAGLRGDNDYTLPKLAALVKGARL